MRDAINNNPRVQIAVIGIAVLLFAFLMLKTFGGGEAPPPPAATAATPAAPGTTAAPATGTPTAPLPTAVGTTPPAVTEVPDNGGKPVTLEAGPGLPDRFVSAYNDDQAIALLIVSRQAHSDRVIEKYVNKAVGDAAELIVIADDRISDYAAVVDGLNVTRTPALVVIRPRSLSGGAPVADVLYGFRGPRSIRQGIEDALYDGPDRSYSP